MSPLWGKLIPTRAGLIRLGLATLSGILMLFAFAPYSVWPLAWFGLVPLLFAAHNQPDKHIFGYGLITGFIIYAGGYPWIAIMADRFMGVPYPYGHALTIVHGLVVGPCIGAGLWAGHKASRWTRMPLLLTLPVAFVAVWSVYPNIFFSQLSHATASWRLVLQPIEWFGAYSLDFVLVLFNVVLFDVLKSIKGRHPKALLPLAPALALIVTWLVSSALLQEHWDDVLDQAPKKRIGLVQPHRPSTYQVAKPLPGYTRTWPFEMELTEQLAADGADLVVWPEGHSYFFTRQTRIRTAFEEHVARFGVPLIMHDKGPDFFDHELEGSTNSSIFIDPATGTSGVNHKRLLVPFGEYHPLTDRFDALKPFRLRGGITPGKAPRLFNTAGMRVQTVICYEMQFGRFVAETIGPDGAGKFIVAQSNDGWFGGKQVYQHNSSNQLRAVETRLPLVHIMNDGPSEVFDAAGRKVFASPHEERGAWIAAVPYDAARGGTLFTAWPNLFVNVMRVLFLALVAWGFSRERRPVR